MNKKEGLGSLINATQLQQFLAYRFKAGTTAWLTPLCIWGPHGIGKTQIIRDFAQQNNMALAEIAPAQFEEMGDLLGMPEIDQQLTVLRAPSWVPTTAGPGILLIDDFNRADDRILRGIMPLLKDGKLISWQLPKGWQIVLTANPDSGDYSVTPLDDALITRMMHVSLQFEEQAWARWAIKAGIDPRGIKFVLNNPDIFEHARTTPRTIVQFLEGIATIKDLKQAIPTVQIIAAACVDEKTAALFIQYIQQGLDQVPTAIQILQAKDFQKEVAQPLRLAVQQSGLSSHLLAALGNQLVRLIGGDQVKMGKQSQQNLKAYLLLDFLPADLRLALAQDLMALGKRTLKSLWTDPELAQLLV